MCLRARLRGAGDTRWPLAITLIGFAGLRLPVAYYLIFYAAAACAARGMPWRSISRCVAC